MISGEAFSFGIRHNSQLHLVSFLSPLDEQIFTFLVGNSCLLLFLSLQLCF